VIDGLKNTLVHQVRCCFMMNVAKLEALMMVG
jgi:hypothetical protein